MNPAARALAFRDDILDGNDKDEAEWYWRTQWGMVELLDDGQTFLGHWIITLSRECRTCGNWNTTTVQICVIRQECCVSSRGTTEKPSLTNSTNHNCLWFCDRLMICQLCHSDTSPPFRAFRETEESCDEPP
jgi:hypothetical protein